MPKRSERDILEEKLTKQLARTSIEYELLGPGDRILVAVSGGKDSYSLLYLLERLRPRLPFELELVAFHLDQCQPGYDGTSLRQWLSAFGVPYRVVKEDTYAVVRKYTKPGATTCPVCSRMRRGIIYTWAEKLGCNKIALGHHRDDAIITLLLNLFFQGRIQAMPAKYHTDDGRFEVIRPLIEIPEKQLARLAELCGFPIVPCRVCSAQPDHKRTAMAELLSELEKQYPNVRGVLFSALKRVRPSHLLDRGLQETLRQNRSGVPAARSGSEGGRDESGCVF